MVGNGGVAKWGMTGRTVEPLLQNLTHHIQMLFFVKDRNRFCQRPMLWWEMESWPAKKWGIGEKRLRTPYRDSIMSDV